MTSIPPSGQTRPTPNRFTNLSVEKKSKILLNLIRETEGPQDEDKIYSLALELAFKDGDLEHETGDGYSIAEIAALRGFRKLIKFIIDKNFIGVNHQTSQGGTMLSAALQEGHEELVDDLLERGANPNQTYIGTMPIHDAVNSGKASLVKRIKDLPDVDVNAQAPGFHHSPLMQAAYYGETDIFKLLLSDHRVDPNLQGYGENTTMHILCGTNNNRIDDESRQTMISALLKRPDVDLSLENEEGFTPAELAKYEHVKVNLNR